MEVEASGVARLEFDCAHGEIPGTKAIGEDGAFSWAGSYVREHGGPIREGEPEDSHPAVYSGAIVGRNMRLRVAVSELGLELDFALEEGRAGRVLKCL